MQTEREREGERNSRERKRGWAVGRGGKEGNGKEKGG